MFFPVFLTRSRGSGNMERWTQGYFMTNSELLAHTQILSRAEKFKMMQFLISELVKEEGIILGDEAAEIIGKAIGVSGKAVLEQLTGVYNIPQ